MNDPDYDEWSDELSEEAIKEQDDEQDDEWERRLNETNDKNENPF